MINTVFVQGTSEGNKIGMELGESVAGINTVIGNTIIGMDMEVNATADIVLRATASGNDFIGLKAGYLSPAIKLIGSCGNFFSGGITSGFNFDAQSHNNRVTAVKLLGTRATVTDTGTFNAVDQVYNISTGRPISDAPYKRRISYVLKAGETATIDASKTSYAAITSTGATMTVGPPTNLVDGQALDITIHNSSGATITTTWDTTWKIAGWVDPVPGYNRSARFRYDASYGSWCVMSMSTVDTLNY
jgi:hypothetical protein